MKKLEFSKLTEAFKNTEKEKRADLIFGCESNPSEELFAFLQNVCTNDQEYDLTRIEAIKSMALSSLQLSQATRSMATNTLIDLCSDDDDDIQTYALQALAWLPYDMKITAIALKMVDPSVYIVVRESALALLTKHINEPMVRDALATLTTDKDFGEYIKSIL